MKEAKMVIQVNRNWENLLQANRTKEMLKKGRGLYFWKAVIADENLELHKMMKSSSNSGWELFLDLILFKNNREFK